MEWTPEQETSASYAYEYGCGNCCGSPCPPPSLSSVALSQVNDIRRSLAVLARDSTAFGLPQPHLNRTGLCDIPESSFDPNYISARDQLRSHLHTSARGKRMGGEPLDGAGLADLVESLVQACAASVVLAAWCSILYC